MSSARSRISLVAPAKVNLYLGVGARRDDGYHDVDTVLQAVSLADTVALEPSDGLSLSCQPPIGLPAEENLAYRAAIAWGERFGLAPDAHIVLEKRVPAGGGLGGASSDAAAVLLGLSSLAGLLDREDATLAHDLADIAASLGADVPFFLEGGTALFGGRGDILVRRLATPALHLALVRADEPVPTGAAYAAFDRLLRPPAPGPAAVVRACEERDAAALARVLYNNMTEASIGLVEPIGEILSWCRASAGVTGSAMAGSGSTVFALCRDAGAADEVVSGARARGWWSQAATSVAKGVRVLEPGEE